MQDVSNKPGQQKTPERNQKPLWFVVVGLGIALFSRSMRDEMLGEVVFWLGVAFSVFAMLYWLFQPKHGFR